MYVCTEYKKQCRNTIDGFYFRNNQPKQIKILVITALLPIFAVHLGLLHGAVKIESPNASLPEAQNFVWDMKNIQIQDHTHRVPRPKAFSLIHGTISLCSRPNHFIKDGTNVLL
jgi:hypothetical protein